MDAWIPDEIKAQEMTQIETLGFLLCPGLGLLMIEGLPDRARISLFSLVASKQVPGAFRDFETRLQGASSAPATNG